MLKGTVAWLTLFEKDADCVAFERVLGEAVARERLPTFVYAVMPSHWHFVVRSLRCARRSSGRVSGFSA
jgi:hypothetical protein